MYKSLIFLSTFMCICGLFVYIWYFLFFDSAISWLAPSCVQVIRGPMGIRSAHRWAAALRPDKPLTLGLTCTRTRPGSCAGSPVCLGLLLRSSPWSSSSCLRCHGEQWETVVWACWLCVGVGDPLTPPPGSCRRVNLPPPPVTSNNWVMLMLMLILLLWRGHRLSGWKQSKVMFSKCSY